MTLHRYLTILRERWVTALATAFIVIAAVAGVTVLQTPVYQSSANVFVRTDPGSSVTDRSAAADYARQQIATYADLVTTPIVLDPAIRSLGSDSDARSLAERVSATVPEDTLLISITANAGDPGAAAELANAVADSLQVQVEELETASGRAAVQLTVVTPATEPGQPSSPDLLQNLVLGLIGAMLAGLLAAILRDLLDNKVRRSEHILQLTDSTVIGTVPRMTSGAAHTFTSKYGAQEGQAEAYRELRSNLRFLELRNKSRSLLVTSSVKGEGKSVTSINLAASLARGNSRVLLVDADLRCPSVHRYLGLEGSAGLSTVLIGDSDLEDVVQPSALADLTVLASGPVPPNPAELLDSDQMTAFLDDAVDRYDVVIVDSAPLLAASDAVALARRVSGTIFVAGCGTVRRPQLSQGLQKLQLVQAHLLGIVLNGVPRSDNTAYSQAYIETAVPSHALNRHRSSMHQTSEATSKHEVIAVADLAQTPGAPVETPAAGPLGRRRDRDPGLLKARNAREA